ncbi:MAG: ABC transporter [Candidatus Neomarinimicrobiota bacterium]|nr:ATP-binding cassette domain-containing protein [Candidatus Neomarinimicrobiota bacterium]RKY51306.1 MAG: ABC transporter [Candidatus Neomarinimicrobiota bacterium]
MLKLEKVTKHFEKVCAVQDVSFQVERGSVYGLLGPNGAGKTTTIRMIMNIIRPDSGTIRIGNGKTGAVNSRNLGYLPEERGLYQKRKIREVIQFFGQLKGLSPKEAAEHCDTWLDRFGMGDQADRKISELSKGNQQKIQFIVASVSFPDLLILDEPFTGLDPVNQIILKDIIREFRDEGKTIVLSTHQMDQVEQLCDHICLINKGRVVLEGALAAIKEEHGDQQIEVRFRSGPGKIPPGLFESYHIQNKILRGYLPESLPFKEAVRRLTDAYDIDGIARYTPSLEDIFIKLVEV